VSNPPEFPVPAVPTASAAPITPVTPAGWYPDYTGEPRLRWWDGAQWTEHVQGGAAQPYSLTPERTKVADGTPVFTPFIWILTFLPLLGLVISHLLSPAVTVGRPSVEDPTAVLRSPAYLANLAISIITYAATIVLAFFDRRQLLARGFDRPFHWAWAFIPVNGVVYVIGRSVIVRRRAGHGISPMWVSIGILVLNFIFSLAVGIAAFSTIVTDMPGVGINT
jgi:hypothetical protein